MDGHGALQTIAPEPLLADMAPLLARLRHESASWARERRPVTSEPRESFASRTGFASQRRGRGDVVLASNTAVELGHPRTESCAFILATWQEGLVHDGAMTLAGPDLPDLRAREQHPHAQVVLLHLRPGSPPDPFTLDNAQYLLHRLPGYMARSVPGRLWVRVADDAVRRGLCFSDVARALMLTFAEGFAEVEGVEVLLVSADPERVRRLRPIAVEASILAGRHKKLVLRPDGEVECTELSCETCEDKPTCDALRDVVVRRRRGR